MKYPNTFQHLLASSLKTLCYQFYKFDKVQICFYFLVILLIAFYRKQTNKRKTSFKTNANILLLQNLTKYPGSW